LFCRKFYDGKQENGEEKKLEIYLTHFFFTKQKKKKFYLRFPNLSETVCLIEQYYEEEEAQTKV
jgi:hypothetical protein